MQFALLLAAIILSACFSSPMEDAPLTLAARNGDVAAIRQAVAQHGDVNAVSGSNGWSPLMHAIHKNQAASVAALLDAGADVNRRGANGVTPLMMAAGYGYTGIVQLLLTRGADPRLYDVHGETAVDYAAAGANDIDRFTLFSCQDDTVRALHAAAPQLKAHGLSLKIANIKMCATRDLVR